MFYTPLHGLFRQCRWLLALLWPLAIYLWQRCLATLLVAVSVLLWSILQEEDKVTCSQTLERHIVCTSANIFGRWLCSLLRRVPLQRLKYLEDVYLPSSKVVENGRWWCDFHIDRATTKCMHFKRRYQDNLQACWLFKQDNVPNHVQHVLHLAWKLHQGR